MTLCPYPSRMAARWVATGYDGLLRCALGTVELGAEIHHQGRYGAGIEAGQAITSLGHGIDIM